MTPDEIRKFQSSALDWFGEPLNQDGVIGPKTQWALDLRTCGPERERVVHTALNYLGTAEDPPGSNSGYIIDQFLAPAGLRGQPWCAAFVSWVLREARMPLSKYHVSVHDMASTERPLVGRAPWPGDVFYLLRQDGTGHCGFVLGGNHFEIMTIEGNCQNAVRLGRRDRGKIRGYINIDGPQVRIPRVADDLPDLDGAPDR